MAILINNSGLRLFLAATTVFLFNSATAEPLPLWELQDDDSRVMLMGSVHFLRASDYPLREGLNQAYEQADTITMELNLSAIDKPATQNAITAISIDPEGRQLRELVGKEAYNEADSMAREIGIPLMMFDQFEPWFAAVSIAQARMLQLGFDQSWGIESVLTRKALAENKPLAGLETMEEQLGFLDRLNPETQRVFLLQALDDAATVQDQVESMVGAWSSGDIAELEELLLESLQETPELYGALLIERNRNWVAPIQALLDTPGTHLVVVGAAHLVGDNSVLELLEDAGTVSRQLSDADF